MRYEQSSECKGHAAHLGPWEYFFGPDGDLHRSQRDCVIDIDTGYRLGSRFVANARYAQQALETHRGFDWS